MLFIPFISSADQSALGRADVDSLSEQTLMELMFANVEDVQRIQKSDGEFRDISEWRFVKLDENGKIKVILVDAILPLVALLDPEHEDRPSSLAQRGTIDLRWILRNALSVEMSELDFQGSICTSLLPDMLVHFRVSKNRLGGTFDVDGLPRSLLRAWINKNGMHGKLNLRALPPPMQIFVASNNTFSGPIDMKVLPETLEFLDLKSNAFNGILEIRELPQNMREVLLSRNYFDVTRLELGLPAEFKVIELDAGFLGSLFDIQSKELTGLRVRYVPSEDED